MPNRHILHCSFEKKLHQQFPLVRVPLETGLCITTVVQLPAPNVMYGLEAHSLIITANHVSNNADFTIIAVVTDDLGVQGLHNMDRDTAKRGLKAFLRKAFDDDEFFHQ